LTVDYFYVQWGGGAGGGGGGAIGLWGGGGGEGVGFEVGDFEKKNTKVQIVYPENCNPITLFAENVLTERYN